MRIEVDFDVCEANAICMGLAPEVFEVDDDDYLNVLMVEPPETMRKTIEMAVLSCPKRAIRIVD